MSKKLAVHHDQVPDVISRLTVMLADDPKFSEGATIRVEEEGDKMLVSVEKGFPTPPPGCTCQHIACVCNILRRHKDGCAFRRA